MTQLQQGCAPPQSPFAGATPHTSGYAQPIPYHPGAQVAGGQRAGHPISELGQVADPTAWQGHMDRRESLRAAIDHHFKRYGLHSHSSGAGACGFDLGYHVATGPDERHGVTPASLEFTGKADGGVKCTLIRDYDGGPSNDRVEFGEWPWPSADAHLPRAFVDAAAMILNEAGVVVSHQVPISADPFAGAPAHPVPMTPTQMDAPTPMAMGGPPRPVPTDPRQDSRPEARSLFNPAFV